MASLVLYPVQFIDSQSAYLSATGIDNPIGKDETNDTYAEFGMITGGSQITKAIYGFDVSHIPANAEIQMVSVKAKCQSSNKSVLVAGNCYIALYSGETRKALSDSGAFGTTAGVAELSHGTWTRAELDSLRLQIQSSRGYLSTSSDQHIRFYGATMTIEYTVPSGDKFLLKIGGAWTEAAQVYKKIGGEWVLQTDIAEVLDADTKYRYSS